MPEITMPRLSDTMQEGTITRWLKSPGDRVNKGEILGEIETDKATMDLEAYEAGVLEQILVQEGATVPIGQPIAIIGTGAGTKASPKREQPETAAATSSEPTEQAASPVPQVVGDRSGPAVSSEPTEQAAPATSSSTSYTQQERVAAGEGSDGARIKASPLARRIAEEYNIDLRQVQGTGQGGRIVRDDIEDTLEQQRAKPAPAVPQPQPAAAPQAAPAPAPEQVAAPPETELIPFSRVQSLIARRLTESKQTIPHFYVSTEIDMTEVLVMRQAFNAAAGEGGVKVTVNDLIVKACALALEKYPEVNSTNKEGQFFKHTHINVGIAVDVPSGLVVPVIRDANIKGVRAIARESKALIEKARTNKLAPADLEAGTFSVSNLGMMDVSEFIAVINPPQTAILAVSSTRKQFVPVDGQPVIRDLMTVTLSADHRLLYGAMVARFLQEVKRFLQNPYSLLG